MVDVKHPQSQKRPLLLCRDLNFDSLHDNDHVCFRFILTSSIPIMLFYCSRNVKSSHFYHKIQIKAYFPHFGI